MDEMFHYRWEKNYDGKKNLVWRRFEANKIPEPLAWTLIFCVFSNLRVNYYEIVVNFFFISVITCHDIQHLSRIYPVCSTYELTKQFMEICVKNCAIDLKKNNLYKNKVCSSPRQIDDNIMQWTDLVKRSLKLCQHHK